MEDMIKQLAPILNVLSPIVLGVLAYWEFNKKNQREKHRDDIESRDKLIASLQKQYEDMHAQWLSSEKEIGRLRKELDERKKEE